MNLRIKFYHWSILFLFPVLLFSCSSDDESVDYIGNWVKRSDFDGVARASASGFSIGTKGYLGLGYNGKKRLNDFWEYNSEINSWTQLSDFPGAARTNASGFSVDSKGYIGTGYDGENYLKDFWEYNPENNTWTQKADFAGTARYGAIGFGINSKGYLGTGYDDNYLKDIYEYDLLSDTWSLLLPSFGGKKRRDASVFVINNKAYICAGVYNGAYVDDFWCFNPSNSDNEKWTELRKISNVTDDSFDDDYSIIRSNATAFATSTHGYLLLGTTGTTPLNSVWEYDPLTDLWTQKTALEGSSRTDAVGFSLNDKIYIATGRSGTYYLDDLWEFEPFVEYNEYD